MSLPNRHFVEKMVHLRRREDKYIRYGRTIDLRINPVCGLSGDEETFERYVIPIDMRPERWIHGAFTRKPKIYSLPLRLPAELLARPRPRG
jgi:hypothetical protein